MSTYKCGAKDCIGHIHPSHKCDPRYVTRKLYVYKFYNAPLASAIYSHVNRAVDIWMQAHIQFRLVFRPIDVLEACRLLGSDPGSPGKPRRLMVPWGPLDRYEEPGYTQRSNLSKMKRSPAALGVFFADADRTAADPGRFQVYIGEDVFGASPGRTVAHEIGHLLLGEGHTGHPDVAWKSGLMIAGNRSSLEDIDDEDADLARKRAGKIPVS